MKSLKLPKQLIIGAIGLVLLIIGFFTYKFLKEPVTYIMVDINPSIELVTNRLGEVVEIIPLNDDAEVLLLDHKFKTRGINQVTSEIIDVATELGYIDELSDNNIITITAASTEEDPVSIETKLNEAINNHLETENVPAIVNMNGKNSDLKAEADSYNIEYGKMVLIEKYRTIVGIEDIDELIDKQISEIAKEINEQRQANLEEDKKLLLNEWKKAKTKLKEAKEEYINSEAQKMFTENKDHLDEILDEIEDLEDEDRDIADEIEDLYDLEADVREKIIEKLIDDRKELIKEQLKNREQDNEDDIDDNEDGDNDDDQDLDEDNDDDQDLDEDNDDDQPQDNEQDDEGSEDGDHGQDNEDGQDGDNGHGDENDEDDEE